MRPSTRLVVLGRKQLWTPAALGSSLALWLDASDFSTITLNGSTVSQWRDKSGNARHASQETVANQPTYTASAYAGKPALTFDGSNDLMSLSSPYISSSGISSIAVLRLSNVTGGAAPYEGINILGSWVGDFIQDFSLGVRQSSVSVYAESGGNTEARAGTVSVNENIIVYGHASSLNTAASLNGEGLSLAGTARNDLRVFGIGKDPVNGNYFYSGVAAEIVLTNGVLSTTDRQRLEGYLAWKWGLTANLPNNHPFRFTPPFV